MSSTPVSDLSTGDIVSPPAESSDEPSANGENTGEAVGLSNPRHSAARRRMLDLVNELHLTGVQVDIDLPVIAVIGSQSAGKSSLIESISGVTLPRAAGTCTRSPTECRLSNSSDPWRCEVSLRILTDVEGKALGQARNIPFGGVIHEKKDVEDRIRRAQLAILNPSTDHKVYLEESNVTSAAREVSFSENSVCLQISGPDIEDLSFVDLPGLIASVGSYGSQSDIELVKNLATRYIERPSCIILLTVACETDFQNQGAHQLARAHDPEGSRTIGVLTKPDRIPAGEEDGWLRYIRNQAEPLEHGWFSVKQPDSRAIAEGITWREARKKEEEFFDTVAPWCQLHLEHQNRLGTAKLVERLSDVLSDKIQQRLPVVQDELLDLLGNTDQQLYKLPKPPSSDALSEVLHLLSTFSRALSGYLEGTPDEKGLLQAIRPAWDTFRAAIRASEPDFRPHERAVAMRTPETCKFVPPAFLANEESPPYVPADDSRSIYIDDVMNRARQAITRELPNHYPFVVSQQYISGFVAQWQKPAEALFREVQRTLIRHIKSFITEHFVQYPLLQSRVHTIIAEFIASTSEDTLKRIQWFLQLEKRPRTLGEISYTDYTSKFLGHYKSCRPTAEQPRATFAKKLEGYNDPESDMHKYMNRVLNGLTDLGMPSVSPTDLAKLLPSDPYDAALGIMAGVRAYFQVAHKRFADNVPMAIDYELVLGLDRNEALEKALRVGLGIGGVDGHKHCKEYIQEPRHISERREELLKKRERLETARHKLNEVWV
ncbi:P-loop containing nucleoside triphosphate hydrolase protein [Trametes elegans]|nr:P-loop containing nucleoside triphosphate hydrolase protein [Trametes elegans]